MPSRLKRRAGFFERFATQGFASFLQQGHSLGERMSHAFQHLFDGGFGNIILIGSDLPIISPALFDQAYAWLAHAEADVVLGPSADGGYYLIGMNRLIPDIFQDMSWSRDDVLARTMAKLAALGVKYQLLPLRYDIDTPEDLRRLQSHCDPRDVSMKNTSTLLHELRRRGKV
ncbi:MAG: TIGR04282 family arsenosugar biosynthesis glycosyltransferase [Candidatus Binatia bacterium]